jgi:RHS repeat-associated protein
MSITVPTAEGNLAGTYTFSQVYTPTTGLLLKSIYPSAGGLSGETVLHGYAGALDLPNTLGSYDQGTTYDAFSRVNQQTLGAGSNLAYVTKTWDPHTGRLTDQLLTRAVATPSTVDEEQYQYDLSGNITQQISTHLGSASTSETQCDSFDGLDELVAAWTATDNCAAQPTTASHAQVADNLGAASAYWTTWQIDPLGDRSNEVDHAFTGGPSSDITTTYGYGNAGAQPHTLTSTGTTGGATGSTSYIYDAAGNMTTRQAAQGNQTISYNDAGLLTAVNGSAGGNSTFVYDANGGLLLQKDPATTTLYLGNEQITLNNATHALSGARYLSLPGGGEVIRTGASSSYTFAIGDNHGSPVLYLDSTAQTPTWRQYTPYGAPRGGAVTAPDNHGFLNKPTDTNTGLTVVGAREYDPATGRFVTLDPVLELTDPSQLNGYGYAGNNPVTHADPTGLCRDDPGTPCGDGHYHDGNGLDGPWIDGPAHHCSEMICGPTIPLLTQQMGDYNSNAPIYQHKDHPEYWAGILFQETLRRIRQAEDREGKTFAERGIAIEVQEGTINGEPFVLVTVNEGSKFDGTLREQLTDSGVRVIQNSRIVDPDAAYEHAEVTGDKVIQAVRDAEIPVEVDNLVVNLNMCGECAPVASRNLNKPGVQFKGNSGPKIYDGDRGYLDGQRVPAGGGNVFDMAYDESILDTMKMESTEGIEDGVTPELQTMEYSSGPGWEPTTSDGEDIAIPGGDEDIE